MASEQKMKPALWPWQAECISHVRRSRDVVLLQAHSTKSMIESVDLYDSFVVQVLKAKEIYEDDMARLLGVYDIWRCTQCQKLAKRVRVDVPHIRRIQRRELYRLRHMGWLLSGSQRKGRLTFLCPNCRMDESRKERANSQPAAGVRP